MPKEEERKPGQTTIEIDGQSLLVRPIVLNQTRHIVEAFKPVEGFLENLFRWFYDGPGEDIGAQWKDAWQGLLRSPDALVRLMAAVMYGPENRDTVKKLVDKPDASPANRKEKDALEFSLFCDWIEDHATIDDVLKAFVAVMHNPSIRGFIAKIQGLDKKVAGTKSQVEKKSTAPSDNDKQPVGGAADKKTPASPGAGLKDDGPAAPPAGESVAAGA